MPNTHGLGTKNYWHFITYPNTNAPRKDVAWTTEFGTPYRNGVGIARRFPFSKFGIVIGRWVSHSEQTAVMNENLLNEDQSLKQRIDEEVESLLGRLPNE